jgi:hypothetical protein
MDLLTIGIVLGAWCALAAALVAIVATAGRADRRDAGLGIVEPTPAPWDVSGSQARAGARRARSGRRAAAEQRLHAGVPTALR